MTIEPLTAKDKTMSNDAPRHRPSVFRRIVEITDEDETLIIEFVPVDTVPRRSEP